MSYTFNQYYQLREMGSAFSGDSGFDVAVDIKDPDTMWIVTDRMQDGDDPKGDAVKALRAFGNFVGLYDKALQSEWEFITSQMKPEKLYFGDVAGAHRAMEATIRAIKQHKDDSGQFDFGTYLERMIPVLRKLIGILSSGGLRQQDPVHTARMKALLGKDLAKSQMATKHILGQKDTSLN